MEITIKLNNQNYKVETDYKGGFIATEVNNKVTPYYDCYDYIVGDWAYGKLRLKGFYQQNNKRVRSYNNIKNLTKYLNNYCAYGCKYFVLKKVDKK